MRVLCEEDPAAGDVILYRCLELSFNASIPILENAYFFIERILARHFVLYCRVRCSGSVFQGASDTFYAFREAKREGNHVSFNMVVNPGFVIRNVTKQTRADRSARILQRAWRRARLFPER
jgi:hypothetical protein